MAYLRTGLVLILTLGASACRSGHEEYAVPLGHPADPGARAGVVLAGSASLEPELQTVKPNIGGSTSQKQAAPPSGAHQHKH